MNVLGFILYLLTDVSLVLGFIYLALFIQSSK